MNISKILITTVFISSLFFSCAIEEDVNTYVSASEQTETDTLFNTIIEDNYRWLEDLDSDKTIKWVSAKDSVSRKWLSDYKGKNNIQRALEELSSSTSIDPPLYAGDNLLYVKQDPEYPQPVLVKHLVAQKTEELLFNPSQYTAQDNLIIRDFSPSPNGQLIVIGISLIGANEVNYIFQETSSGKILADTLRGARLSKFPWVNNKELVYRTTGNEGIPLIKKFSLENPDESITIYEANSNQTVISAEVSTSKDYLVISDGVNEQDIFIAPINNSRSWSLLLPGKSQKASYTFIGNDSDYFWFYTNHNADKGKIIEVEISNFSKVSDLIPEMDEALDQAHFFGGKFLVSYLDKAKPLARIYSVSGKLVNEIDLPVGLSWNNYSFNWQGYSGSPNQHIAFHKNLGLSSSGSVYSIDLNSGKLEFFFRTDNELTNLDIVTKQVFIPLENGQQMPMFVTHKRGIKLDGSNPTLLYVYGAYGWTEIPFINSKYALFIKSGGIHAMPNLRGGGALGNQWYQDGIRHNKPKTISDAITASEWLIKNKYTNPKKLLIEGNSAGTIVAMGALNKKPELYGAAVLEVPLSDLIRILKFRGGAGWISQFGNPENEEDFEVLYSYSPYHNIKQDLNYPPIFIAPGELDLTAPPLHGYKLAAALQEKQKGKNPILMRVNWGGDHSGGNTEKRTNERIDELIFMAKTLGIHF